MTGWKLGRIPIPKAEIDVGARTETEQSLYVRNVSGSQPRDRRSKRGQVQ